MVRTPVVLALVALVPEMAWGQEIDLSDIRSIEDLSLEDLLSTTVTTATKSETTARKTPAVVTVITSDEIHARGYTSLAEVIRTVPGFFDVYDLGTHNVGVRGVSGGARAMSNIIKVMIDGQPVPYRPSTGNFFGPELIPLEAVDRIEIIRGPASALYGANAFLGVINVITRYSGQSAFSQQVGMVRGNLGIGSAVVVVGEEGPIKAMVGVYAGSSDRSGLFVADSSPALQRTASPLDERGNSRRDESHPRSIIFKVGVGDRDKPTGEATAWTSMQILDAGGEFQSFEPLTHETRVNLANRHHRLSWGADPIKEISLDAFATVFDSRPGSSDVIGLDRDDLVMLRNVGVTGYEMGFEIRSLPRPWLSTVLGVDYQREEHNLQSYDQLLLLDVFDPISGTKIRNAGTVIPSDEAKRSRQLGNHGVYLQLIGEFGPAISLTAGGRVDQHNVYGHQLSPRAAAVFAPDDEAYHVKLMYGSSFKAPTAEQLYTEPIKQFDITGNRQLDAQTASNVELAGGYAFSDLGEVEVNGFVTQIDGRVEYIQHDLYLFAENAVDETVIGAEVAGRIRPAPFFMARLGLGLAQISAQEIDKEFALFTADEIPTTYPPLQVHLLAELKEPRNDIRLTPEISYVSKRASSQSNSLQAFGAYDFDPYVFMAVSAAAPEFYIARNYPTRVVVRVTDLLDSQGAEPGFNGIDYPVLGRRGWLTVTQAF